MTTRIRALTLTPLQLRLRAPLRTASGTYHERAGILLEAATDSGESSLGEATPLPAFGTESLEACREALEVARRALEGLAAPDSPEAVRATVERLLPGSMPAARHGLELCMLGLVARARGVPLRRLLNPGARDRLSVNALLFEEFAEALAAEGAAAVRQGYRTLKVKVGGRALDEDVAWLRTLRAAVGPEVKIRVDANGAWTPDQARAALSTFEALALELCEQPVAASQVDELATLASRSTVPLAADEALALPEGPERLLAVAGRVRLWVLKPMVLGGVLRAFELAQRAEAAGIACYVTSSLEGPVGRRAAAELAAALPDRGLASGLAVGSLFDGPDPFPPRDGSIDLVERPC